MTLSPVLCLASASPRRRELLRQIGVPHCVAAAELDERLLPSESAAEHVKRLALAKARAVQASRRQRALPALPVLGADTTVTIDGQVLGKPASESDLLQMFARLAGRTHEVFSAVALVHESEWLRLVRTEVSFRSIDPAEARAYWASGEPRDKAGGYAIQGFGAVFVTSIVGSYSNVVGLPLAETAELLAAAGVPRWQGEV